MNLRIAPRSLMPLLLVAAGLLSPAATEAQVVSDTTVRDTTAQRFQSVTVTTARLPAAVGGASAVLLRPDSIRLSPAPLLGEALRELPFVLVRQNSRGETELSIRGSESRQTAVMLDGMPLTLGWDNRSDPSLIPLSGVQSIMLVRGLSSLLHGPNVLGGIIDIGVGASAPGAAAHQERWLSSGLDQHGARSLSLGAGVPMPAGERGRITLRAGTAYRQRAGYPVTDDARDAASSGSLRTNSDLRQVDGFASIRWNGSAGRNIGTTFTGYSAERGVPPELHVTSPRLWRYPEQNRVLAIVSGGSGLMATPFGYGSVDFSGGFNTGNLEIESYEDDRYTTVVDRERGDERAVSARLTAKHSLAGSGEIRFALTGGEVRYDETLGAANPNHYLQRVWSAASEGEWPVRRATVSGGVVYDGASTPETGGKPALGRLGAHGWRAGISAPLGLDAARLHASASRRSRFPALRELYSGSLDRFQPNTGLRPETLLGFEAGATVTAGPLARRGVSMQLVAFHHRLDDAIVRVAVPDSRRFMRVNRDEIRSTGGELMAGWSSASPEGRAFTISGDVLAQHVRALDGSAGGEGRRPEHQPAVRGSVDIGAPLPLMLRGWAGASYTSRQHCINPETAADVTLGETTSANAGVERSWRVGGPAAVFTRLRAMLAVDNLANATIHDQCGLPQPGRAIRLGVQLR